MDHTSKSDNSSILPSSTNHVWGRVCSVGFVTISISSSLIPKIETLPNKVKYAISPLMIEGCGQSIVVEWCQPTFRTLFLLSEHLIGRYGKITAASNTSLSVDYSKLISKITISVEGFNGLIYGNDPYLMVLLRIDSYYFEFQDGNPLMFKFYGIASDQMYFKYYLSHFECVSTVNLPVGGFLNINTCYCQYFQVSN